ncbi:MAG: hypothetical protein R2781_00735 [Flavobacteriaceae bacterium]
MTKIDLQYLESQLQKRLSYRYQWGRFQNNEWDSYTGFIYDTPSWEQFVLLLKQTHQNLQVDKGALFDYAANRWFNFWSAMGVELIFNESEWVQSVWQTKDSEKDFFLKDIPFDHKTSVFPKGFGQSLEYAQNHKEELITWLYTNQSTEQRYHLKNRLFVVVYDAKGFHWKLKAELSLIKKEIEKYLANFQTNQLHSFNFDKNHKSLSDIIFVSNK